MKIKGIENIRSKIDSIDRKIIKLLVSRMEFSKKISTRKKEITDSEREAIVLRNIEEESKGRLPQKFLKKIFSLIIEESKKIQHNKKDQS